jgi:hypothetical protein
VPLTAPDVLSTSVVGRCLERDTCSEMPQHGLGLVCVEVRPRSAPERGVIRVAQGRWAVSVRTSCTTSRRPRGAARAADTAPWPSLSLPLRSGRGPVPVGWREGHSFGAAEGQAVTQAAADLTREPSRRPKSGSCGQARSQPDPRASVRAATPCQIRHSVRAGLAVCPTLPHA